MTRAICIGECMVELRPAEGGLLKRGFAGDTYNTAVYLKRSAPEIRVQYATATGTDPLSAEMRAAWAAEGIEDGLAVSVPNTRPGLYLIELDGRGERKFHYWRGESAARQWFAKLRREDLRGADLVHLSGISLAILTEEERREAIDFLAGLRLSFDPNIRPSLWNSIAEARDVFEKMAGLADILLPSAEDIELLYGGMPEDLFQRLGVREAALTLDAGRCRLLDGQEVSGPLAERVVDTSGAGDSFDGAYLAARLRGVPPAEAARAGLALAAKVVGSPGAVIAREEVES